MRTALVVCALLAGAAVLWLTRAPSTPATVRDAECRGCHQQAFEQWSTSHHAKALQRATDETVLGHFTHRGDAGEFLVALDDGQLHRVDFTFGIEPLQQYLVADDGGRWQVAPEAWDVARAQWFALDGGFHWSSRYQTWNLMCADCHSTVRSRYDVASDTYATELVETAVGCQACHGDGAAHLANPKAAFKTKPEACFACHSRRVHIGDEADAGSFDDAWALELLRPELYEVDGQQRGEVFEVGSYLQSRMHARGVRCVECHQPHGGKLVREGNALCTECHRPTPAVAWSQPAPQNFDRAEHHHHAPDSPGSQCVACHMPERIYMQLDARRDHSIRVPRPDLSVRLGTPNACNVCHLDRDAAWAARAVEQWFPQSRHRGPHYGEAFARARAGDTAALVEIAHTEAWPPIVRATVIDELPPSNDPQVQRLKYEATRDPSPLVRAATRQPELQNDPVRRVRIAAGNDREMEAAYRLTADAPASAFNLGALADKRGDAKTAELEYARALRLDPALMPAAANLGKLHDRLRRPADAERVFRAAIAASPDAGELHYSLGLLLAQQQRWAESVQSLERAAHLLPTNERVKRNLDLARGKMR